MGARRCVKATLGAGARNHSMLHWRFSRGLTFDMRGGRKWAKPACGRPLDGRVRRRGVARRAREIVRPAPSFNWARIRAGAKHGRIGERSYRRTECHGRGLGVSVANGRLRDFWRKHLVLDERHQLPSKVKTCRNEQWQPDPGVVPASHAKGERWKVAYADKEQPDKKQPDWNDHKRGHDICQGSHRLGCHAEDLTLGDVLPMNRYGFHDA
jgi:hypothetical protein